MKTCGEANFSTICPTPSPTTVPGSRTQCGGDSGHLKRDPSRWFHSRACSMLICSVLSPAARNVFPIKIPGRLPVRISDFEAAAVRHGLVFDDADCHWASLPEQGHQGDALMALGGAGERGDKLSGPPVIAELIGSGREGGHTTCAGVFFNYSRNQCPPVHAGGFLLIGPVVGLLRCG